MATTENPPRREIGSVAANNARVFWPGGVPGWSAFATDEHVPELKGTKEITTYDQMLTNPQVWALAIGMLLPCMDYDIGVEVGDADPAMAAVLAGDLGLPLGLPDPGDTAPQIEAGAFGFNFPEHMWEALFAPLYGRYYFEQVAEVVQDRPGGGEVAHLKRLAPRAPHDISDIITDDDGGLAAIMHPGVEVSGGMRFLRDVPIPVSQLVAYVWLPTSKRRWVGRSMLRPCYEPYVLRDRAVRIDIINHGKAGGVPVVTTDETWQGSNLGELRDMASQFRVGDDSGAALPPGAHLQLARVGGTDVVASMRYHDESMARAWGSMVRQLGSTATGSRALGDTMEGMEAVIRRAIMRWFTSTFRAYVIRDWWLWNVDASGKSPCPSIVWRPRDDGQVPGDPGLTGGPPPDPPRARSASALAGRTGDARAATITEAVARKDAPRWTGGEMGEDGDRSLGSELASGSGGHSRDRLTNRGHLRAARLPDRPLRRQPYEHELRAAVDFAAMDVAYEDGLASTERLLNETWLPQLTQAAEDAITFTKGGTVRKRLTRLDAARLRLAAPDPEPLVRILLDAARTGSAAAAAELSEQGVGIVPPSDDELLALVRDHAAAVAQQTADGVTLAASRRAIQVNAGRTPGEVASEVSNYLRGLKHDWERSQLAGAVQMATNVSRLNVFARIPSEFPSAVTSSEILDVSTCSPCAAIDGYVFSDMQEATRFYGSGGYVDCRGGPRCRGTVVLTLDAPEPVFPPGLGPG